MKRYFILDDLTIPAAAQESNVMEVTVGGAVPIAIGIFLKGAAGVTTGDIQPFGLEPLSGAFMPLQVNGGPIPTCPAGTLASNTAGWMAWLSAPAFFGSIKMVSDAVEANDQTFGIVLVLP